MTPPQKKYQGGDAQAGYQLEVQLDQQRFFVRMWGLWKDPALLPQFKLEVMICINALAERGPWDVFGDLTNYTAQPTVIGDLISNLMREAMRKKFRKCAVLYNGMVARLFINRLATMVGMTTLKFFDTREQAFAYLSES